MAYLRTLGRLPTDAERAIAQRHLEAAVESSSNGVAREGLSPAGAALLDAWTGLFHALFSSLDFRYLN